MSRDQFETRPCTQETKERGITGAAQRPVCQQEHISLTALPEINPTEIGKDVSW